MLFLVLCDIPISVFLNSLVIVLISGTMKVKVAHFFFYFFIFLGFLFLLYGI
jgi:hypothetical protein